MNNSATALLNTLAASTMNNYPQTEEEIEDAIAEGELCQDKVAAQSYEDSGWRDQEDQESYERSFGI